MAFGERKRTGTSSAFMISVGIHLAAAIALTFYILIEKEIIPNPFGAEFVAPPPPPKPQVRKPQVRQIPKPVVITDTPVAVQPQVTTRVTTAAVVKT